MNPPPHVTSLAAILAVWLVGCQQADPKENNDQTSDSDSASDAGPVTRDACIADAFDDYDRTTGACVFRPTDYQPATPEADSWDACISDDNTYHRIEESISSIARVAAFDAMAPLLWDNPNVPTKQDFIDARVILDEAEGLGSRLDRRYDIHYDAPPDGASCSDEGIALQYPSYCVGPATLRPAINDAFAEAAKGLNMQKNAEVIHSALEWFLYVSVIKEATTCTDTAKDCDSSWAYYTGGTERETPAGLAAELNYLSSYTHDRVYDGTLAVRCWRDLDQAVPAADTDMRDSAIGQLDNALIFGMAQLIRQKFAAVDRCTDKDEQLAAFAGAKLLVGLFDRAVRAQSPETADLLQEQIKGDMYTADGAAAIDALDALFICP